MPQTNSVTNNQAFHSIKASYYKNELIKWCKWEQRQKQTAGARKQAKPTPHTVPHHTTHNRPHFRTRCLPAGRRLNSSVRRCNICGKAKTLSAHPNAVIEGEWLLRETYGPIYNTQKWLLMGAFRSFTVHSGLYGYGALYIEFFYWVYWLLQYVTCRFPVPVNHSFY